MRWPRRDGRVDVGGGGVPVLTGYAEHQVEVPVAPSGESDGGEGVEDLLLPHPAAQSRA